jgi:GH15 family glucan-1,4-alpha-glucosidase
MTDLFQRSIEIILQNQSPAGAYLASPNFPTYNYCWFRDGAFIAYAMNLAGEHESAHRFHKWASVIVNQRSSIIKRAIAKAQQNVPLDSTDILHTRYTVEGEAGDQEWPNYQLDGLGAWLWSLDNYQQLSEMSLPQEWLQAAGLVTDYLAALWQRPCYDCWEEFPEYVHMYTVAAIYAGLQAHTSLTGVDHESILTAIKQFLHEEGESQGHFVKYLGSEQVDASLLGLATPYNVVSPDDPIMRVTLAQIEATLYRDGGVHRYPDDTYYGGGAWVLLTAWLGWYYTQIGANGKASSAKKWVEAQADAKGNLPEQVPITLNDPSYHESWRQRWGEIASPLLWSHAQYIILSLALHPQTCIGGD